MTKHASPFREDAAAPEPEATEAEAPVDTTTGEVTDEPGPLSKLQDGIRELLDFDQIAEIRLALSGRAEEIEKHLKKASQLGIREEDARRRLRLIEGSDTRFGLTRIFAAEDATYGETRDLFFDAEKTNGRPEGTITFRTVDGVDITCTLEQLELADKIMELRALHRAGILPSGVEKAIRDGDFWHLIEDEEMVGAE